MTSNLSICHLTASYRVISCRRLYEREARTARQAGCAVTIIGLAEDSYVACEDDGCKIIQLPRTGRYGKILNAWRLFQLGLREKCSVYHCHDLASLISGMMLKCLTGRRLLYDAHEDYPRTHAANLAERRPLLRTILHAGLQGLEWLCLRSVDEIITVDPFLRQKFARMGCQPASVLPNASRRRPLPEVSSPWPEWRNRRVFIYSGRLSHHVAVLEMIQAVQLLRARHPDMLLALIGDFWDEPYRRQIERYLEENDLSANVRLYDPVPADQIPGLLQHVFVGLVLYGADDNYGDLNIYVLKLMEYLAAGLPVILTSFRGFCMFVRRWRCGLTVDAANPAEIARGFERFLQDPAFAEDCREASRRAFEAYFHWEKHEPRLLRAYQRLHDLGLSRIPFLSRRTICRN